MRRLIVLTIFLLASSAPSVAQVTFKRAWSWYGNSKGNTVLQADDGGFVVGAQAHPTPQIGSALIRTDSLGDTLWVRFLEYKGGGGGWACRTTDRCYVIVSDTIDAQSGGYMVTATKVGKYGEVIWSYYYPPPNYNHPRSVWPTSDGGVVVCGKFADGSGYGAGLKKFDSAGGLTWTRILRYSVDTALTDGYSVQQTQDGGFIAAGRLDGENGTHAFLAKTDSSGDTVWTRTIAGEMPCFSVRQTADGGYIVAGRRPDSLNRTRAYLIKTDSVGDPQWLSDYGWGSDRYYGTCVRQVADGGYVVAGHKRPGGVSWAIAWLLRTDSTGDTLWTREYPYPPWSSTIFYWVEQTSEGGFVMTGEVSYHNVHLVKTDSLGLVHGGGVEEPPRMKAEGGRMSQTICRGVLRLPGRLQATLLDITGRRVMELQLAENDIRHFAPGVYFVRGEGPRGQGSQDPRVRKVVIQR